MFACYIENAVCWLQVLSLTTGALMRVLDHNPSKDIRNLLKGSSKIMAGLIDGYSADPGYLVEAHCPLRMVPEVRSLAADALQAAVKASTLCRVLVLV